LKPIEPASPATPAEDLSTPPGARKAASVLLLRDAATGPGVEVLMLRRAEREGDQNSGAMVFPGGVLDVQDHQAHGLCEGPDDVSFSARLGLPEGGLDYAVAALRETFEEVGLLLAVAAGSGPVDALALQPWRARLHGGQASVTDFCKAANVRFDVNALAYFSHWLTPPGAPKRFDTRFFAAMAPAGQVAQADLTEASELMWLTPAQALDKARGYKLLPVTQRTLQELAAFTSATQALHSVRQRDHFPRIMPRRAMAARGPRVVLPQDLPYAEVGRLDPQGRGDVWCEIEAGRAVRLSPRIVRVTAPNPGAMTGPGTNSYLVNGVGVDVAAEAAAQADVESASAGLTVIDPGPVNPAHVQALLVAAQAQGLPITRIIVTHTHGDHSPGAVALSQATGAPVFGKQALHEEWQDKSFAPQRELLHGERLAVGAGTRLRVIHTPGHASNHLCFLLEEEETLFTGDHVMQGSTVVINPPDGDMAAYLKALHELLDEPLQWLAPGHGFLVTQPQAVLRALIAHRGRREAKVLAVLQTFSPATLAALLPHVYDDVSPSLHAMASRSLWAHLLKLQGEGRARTQGSDWHAV
jgi:glyoxylase-like metal-dependent hydrolase (beta-lactamase superfamily II)/8-oxo-dGTP pyrophosphatase MutT (NUDIX family)